MNISTSLICMNMANVEKDISMILDAAGNDSRFSWFHMDLMDNSFVPRLGISPELVRDVRQTFPQVHIDCHLMVSDPFTVVDVIAPYSDWIVYHLEAVSDPVRTLQKIRKNWPNVKVGLALNLTTQFDPAQFQLFDGVMFMGISPGVLGTNSYPMIVKQKIGACPNQKHYFVDGSVNFNTIRDYRELNNNGTLVCGSSTMFKIDNETKDMTREEMINYNVNRIKESLGCERQ
jgi:ribulose-phosphate 3-epimerase